MKYYGAPEAIDGNAASHARWQPLRLGEPIARLGRRLKAIFTPASRGHLRSGGAVASTRLLNKGLQWIF